MTTLVCVNDFVELMAAARLLLLAAASTGLGVRTGSGSTGGSVKLNLFFDMVQIPINQKICSETKIRI